MITDKIFAIDVGTTESGYAIMRFDKDDIKLLSFGKIANEALMQIIKNDDYDQLVYEQFQSFGMAVGESTIECRTGASSYLYDDEFDSKDVIV